MFAAAMGNKIRLYGLVCGLGFCEECLRSWFAAVFNEECLLCLRMVDDIWWRFVVIVVVVVTVDWLMVSL